MSKHKPNYSCFTFLFSGLINRIVLPLRVAEAFDPSVTDPQNVAWHDTDALWDTGATHSVITEATAAKLGLQSVGKITINHAGGPEIRDRYMVNVRLPNGVMITGVAASDCHNLVGNFGAIVGMDIISRGDITITNHDNQTCMTFRTPTVGRVDYVKEFSDQLHAATNANDPCPCGATDVKGLPRKYRNCHGKPGQLNRFSSSM
jgi:hypothetical protein